MSPSAKVICDSISPLGHRLTTLEVKYHRFVLAEMNTHRVFSRNTASSRAIPYQKLRRSVLDDPAFPLSWPEEKKGMQGGKEFVEALKYSAEVQWTNALHNAIETADKLHALGLHKSVINRLLEPFQYVTSIITATDWQGFWEQRCSPLAQPEIRAAAEVMKSAYDRSIPQEVGYGDWHLPYITSDDLKEAYDRNYDRDETKRVFKMLSSARCARVSYLTHDGRRDWNADLDLYERLTTASPPHWSPLEHPATPIPGYTPGNFTGWKQLRHALRKREIEHDSYLL